MELWDWQPSQAYIVTCYFVDYTHRARDWLRAIVQLEYHNFKLQVWFVASGVPSPCSSQEPSWCSATPALALCLFPPTDVPSYNARLHFRVIRWQRRAGGPKMPVSLRGEASWCCLPLTPGALCSGVLAPYSLNGRSATACGTLVNEFNHLSSKIFILKQRVSISQLIPELRSLQKHVNSKAWLCSLQMGNWGSCNCQANCGLDFKICTTEPYTT